MADLGTELWHFCLCPNRCTKLLPFCSNQRSDCVHARGRVTGPHQPRRTSKGTPLHLSQGTVLGCGPGAACARCSWLSPLSYLLLCFLSEKILQILLTVLWGYRGEDYNTAAPDQSTPLYISSFPSPFSQPSLSFLPFIFTPATHSLLKSPSCPQRASMYPKLAKPP